MVDNTLNFLLAAAKWGHRRDCPVSFVCDELDDWFAVLTFKDSEGQWVHRVAEIGRNSKETDDEFCDRVAGVLSKESARARQERIKALSRRLAA